MTYAVIATYKLPDTMGGAVIAEVCLGRFNGFTQAKEEQGDCEKQHPDLVEDILELLQHDLDIQALKITYHTRFEGK